MIFLLLPEVEILDLAGPLQAFHEANRSHARYSIRICSTRETFPITPDRYSSRQPLKLGKLRNCVPI